jgi:hypothetical protein
MTRASNSLALLLTTPTGSCWAASRMKKASQNARRVFPSDVVADPETNKASPRLPRERLSLVLFKLSR